jgi:hypothetical protein
MTATQIKNLRLTMAALKLIDDYCDETIGDIEAAKTLAYVDVYTSDEYIETEKQLMLKTINNYTEKMVK